MKNSNFTLIDPILEKARRIPQKIAFYREKDKHWIPVTHAEFYKDILNMTQALKTQSIQRGDRVGIFLPNSYEWEVADKAIMLLGAISVGIDTKLRASDIERIVSRTDMKICITDPTLVSELKLQPVLPSLLQVSQVQSGPVDEDLLIQQLQDKISSDDIATILFTSGTTGEPKGIPLTHRQIMSSFSSFEEIFFKEGQGDHVTISWISLCNGTGRTISANNYNMEVIQYLLGEPLQLFEKIKSVNPTFLVVVPRILQKVQTEIQKKLKASSLMQRFFFHGALILAQTGCRPLRLLSEVLVTKKLRRAVWGQRLQFLFSGSAAISIATLDFFEGLGIPTYEVYGLSEVASIVSINRPNKKRHGSVGIPLSMMDVKIAEDGEILVKSSACITKYWQSSENDLLTSDAYLKTGDLGVFRDSFLYILGRKKELVKTSTGQRIAPLEIEQTYSDIIGIENFVVFGDGQKYLTALIGVDPIFQSELEKKGVSLTRYLEEEITKRHLKLAKNHQIKKWICLPKPLSIENGELTPTLKLRRKVIEKNYQGLILSLYNQDMEND